MRAAATHRDLSREGPSAAFVGVAAPSGRAGADSSTVTAAILLGGVVLALVGLLARVLGAGSHPPLTGPATPVTGGAGPVQRPIASGCALALIPTLWVPSGHRLGLPGLDH